MTCRKVERLLTENFRSADNDELARHLAECDGCRRLQQDLKALAELSGEIKKETEAPAFFTSRVCARISEPGPARRSLTFAVLTVSAVVVFSLGLLRFTFLTDKPANATNQSVVRTGSAGEDWSVEQDWRADSSLPASGIMTGPENDARFVEILVGKPSESDYIVRLPSTIEVRNSQAENEYYLRNVSH